MEESETGFIQVAFLGIKVSAEQVKNMPPNPNPMKGKPERIEFKKLGEVLSRPDWVPTDKAAVLAWLALGAPNAGRRPRFGGHTAGELFEEIVTQCYIQTP